MPIANLSTKQCKSTHKPPNADDRRWETNNTNDHGNRYIEQIAKLRNVFECKTQQNGKMKTRSHKLPTARYSVDVWMYGRRAAVEAAKIDYS